MRRLVTVSMLACVLVAFPMAARSQATSMPGTRPLSETEARECRRFAHDFLYPQAEGETPAGTPKSGDTSWVSQVQGRTAAVAVPGWCLADVSLSRGFVSSVLFLDVAPPNCEDPAGLAAKAIPLSQAQSAAVRFLSERGLNSEVASLVLTQSTLGPASGRCAYTFAWSEPYDENGVALTSEQIRVVVQPFSGEIVSFSRRNGTYRKPVAVSPDRCRAIVAERFGSRPGFRVKRLNLKSVFSPAEAEVPIWVVDFEYLGKAEPPPGSLPQDEPAHGELKLRNERVVVHAETGALSEDVREFLGE